MSLAKIAQTVLDGNRPKLSNWSNLCLLKSILPAPSLMTVCSRAWKRSAVSSRLESIMCLKFSHPHGQCSGV